MGHRLLVVKEPLFWTFRWWEIRSFLSQKIGGNIFTGYWKVLVLRLSVMENTVFLMQKVNGNMAFTDHWKVFVVGYRQFLLLNFSVMGNMDFFSQNKSWCKDVYLAFLSFPLYSRTWEIRVFVQWEMYLQPT